MLEPEPLIQAYRWLIIRVDLKFQSREVEPVIRQIKTCAHQGCSDTFALPLIVHAHPDCSDVPPPGSVRESNYVEHPHHTITHDCHQFVDAVVSLCKPLSPLLTGWIW